jgi:GNAT superfamily N-acetyltransferase
MARRSTAGKLNFTEDKHMDVAICVGDKIECDEVIALYEANSWSSAAKPDQLLPALRNSHSLVTARIDGHLVGLANAISDGHLVVYFPHMLVHPAHHRKGIGKRLMAALQEKYADFHQQMLTADGDAIQFYESIGFRRAGNTAPMWIYAGTEH